MLQPEDVLQNRYRAVVLLGQGGMGVVYPRLGYPPEGSRSPQGDGGPGGPRSSPSRPAPTTVPAGSHSVSPAQTPGSG